MSEDALLAKCHKWLWNTYPKTHYLCWHVANERATSHIQGAKLKAKGVLSGVPDYVLNWNGKTYYFEFKSEKGKLSENQIAVISKLLCHDISVSEIRDFETFQKIINQILYT